MIHIAIVFMALITFLAGLACVRDPASMWDLAQRSHRHRDREEPTLTDVWCRRTQVGGVALIATAVTMVVLAVRS